MVKKGVPALKNEAVRLFSVCFVIIVAYVLCIITYILCIGAEEITSSDAYNLVHSMMISALITLCATLIFDVELRRGSKK